MRWLALLLFVVLLGSLFVRLGEWQLHRLEQRRETNARITAFHNQPVKPYQEVFGGPIGDDPQWQRVSVTGSYDAKHQLQAMLRNQGGKAGSEVLTPMRTEQGDWLLVDRGFIPRAQGANEIAVLPDPPTGRVTVTGYVKRSEYDDKPNAMLPEQGTVRLVNTEVLSQHLPYTLLDGYVGLIDSSVPQAGDLQPITPPELTEGPHLSYALQWFTFTVIAVIGAAILVRGDLRDRRKALARREKAAAQAENRESTDSLTAPRRTGEDE
ncbi:hypothetical protein GCM10009599_07350 [Luteococcus peritonei]